MVFGLKAVAGVCSFRLIGFALVVTVIVVLFVDSPAVIAGFALVVLLLSPVLPSLLLPSVQECCLFGVDGSFVGSEIALPCVDLAWKGGAFETDGNVLKAGNVVRMTESEALKEKVLKDWIVAMTFFPKKLMVVSALTLQIDKKMTYQSAKAVPDSQTSANGEKLICPTVGVALKLVTDRRTIFSAGVGVEWKIVMIGNGGKKISKQIEVARQFVWFVEIDQDWSVLQSIGIDATELVGMVATAWIGVIGQIDVTGWNDATGLIDVIRWNDEIGQTDVSD